MVCMTKVFTFDFIGHVVAPFFAKNDPSRHERVECEHLERGSIPQVFEKIFFQTPFIVSDFGFNRVSRFSLITIVIKIETNIVVFVIAKDFNCFFGFIAIQFAEVDCWNDDFKVAIALAEFGSSCRWFSANASPPFEERLMNFGQALEALKTGRRVARDG